MADHEDVDQAGRLARVEVKVDLLETQMKTVLADGAEVKKLLWQINGAMRMLVAVLWVLTILFAGALGAGKLQALVKLIGI